MRAMIRSACAALVALAGPCAILLGLGACDKEPSKLDQIIESGTQAAAAPAASASGGPDRADQGPKPPHILVQPGSTMVGDTEVKADDPDGVAKITALITGKPHVAMEVVDFAALRKARPSQVATVVRALRKAGAVGATVLTETREKTVFGLPLRFPSGALPECSAVAYINKDSSINVWTIAGSAPAKRYSKGWAGPDMTLGAAAAHDQAEACPSGVWFVAADDATQSWGVLFDLAYYATRGLDGGASMRADTALLATPPVPGRKVATD
jgi:hypothetical protein